MGTPQQYTDRLPYLPSPLQLPQRTVGDYSITHRVHPAGERIPVVSLRSALLGGGRPQYVTFNGPLTIHRLEKAQQGVLMSDSPQELFQATPCVRRAKGHVLVGGLGLGMVAELFARKRTVKTVDVVEINEHVIALTGGNLHAKVQLHNADLFVWLEELQAWTWDYAFFDIWYPTSEGTWIDMVAPLRRIVRRKFGVRPVDCWAEAEMLGQLHRALAMDAAMGAEVESCWGPAHKAFRAGTLSAWPVQPTALTSEEGMSRVVKTDAIQWSRGFRAAFNHFTRDLGSPAWEARFGKLWPLAIEKGGDD